MKRLPKQVWRGIHFTSYVTFLLTSVHGTFAGSDATNQLYVATTAVTTGALAAAIVYRVATRRATQTARAVPVA